MAKTGVISKFEKVVIPVIEPGNLRGVDQSLISHLVEGSRIRLWCTDPRLAFPGLLAPLFGWLGIRQIHVAAEVPPQVMGQIARCKGILLPPRIILPGGNIIPVQSCREGRNCTGILMPPRQESGKAVLYRYTGSAGSEMSALSYSSSTSTHPCIVVF